MSVGEIDWGHEGERLEREMYGLVRAIMVKAMRSRKRPYIAFGEMVDDAAIFAWRSWRSLRLRGLEPQEIGVWAIADQCVRMALGGVQFRPVGRGDRCSAGAGDARDTRPDDGSCSGFWNGRIPGCPVNSWFHTPGGWRTTRLHFLFLPVRKTRSHARRNRRT